MANNFSGVVVRTTGVWYTVRRADGTVEECRVRGRLRLKGVRSTSPVVVGDVVDCTNDGDDGWAIDAVQQRRNYIIRRASNLSKESHIIAANIDRAFIVVTLFSPATPVEFVDRFLVTCEAYGIPATIILSKADLLAGAEDAVAEFKATYTAAGYEVVEVSSVDGRGVGRVRELLVGQTTLVSGNSGVGKSTLIGVIEPDAEIRTGEISESHHKGKHTTTLSTMYPLTDGGYIVDTPGIKGFGLIDIGEQELWHYFPEMMRYAPECQFYNCTHTHEPRCAVVEAVKRGDIAYSRYESYLKILDEDGKYRK